MTSNQWIGVMIVAVVFFGAGMISGIWYCSWILHRAINEKCSVETRRRLMKEMGWHGRRIEG